MPLSIGYKLVSMKLFKQNERAAGSEGNGGPSQDGQPSGSAQKASTQRGNVVSIFGRGKDRRTKHELEFLPAAIEIVETPPSPIGRAIGLVLIVVFCVALLWAWLGTVDIVAVAHGKIVPSGRTKVIQPFETGVVRSIYVHDGQSVRAGDVLVALDPTITQADVGRLKDDFLAAEVDVARLRAAASGNVDPSGDFVAPKGATPSMVESYRDLLMSQAAEQKAKLALIDRQEMQKRAERETVEATIKKLQATIPILQQRVDVRKQLYDKALGSKLTYLSDLEKLVAKQQDLEVQRSRHHETEEAIDALKEAHAKAVEEYRRGIYDELTKAEQKVASLRQDVIKAEERAKLQRLTSPVDGTVQQLAIHTVGGVVTAAQALMVIVPKESKLEVEAMVSNRDIGFVHEGQTAEIKVDTFNFTRYGFLHGKVTSISSDSITRALPQARANAGNLHTSSSEPKGQELVYAARVSLDRTTMRVDDKTVNLSPGMAVTVEIKTGSRRVISYLLSPIFRYKQESFHER